MTPNINSMTNTSTASNSNFKTFTCSLAKVEGISKAGRPYEYIRVTVRTAMGDIPLTVWSSDRSYLALEMVMHGQD